ncbi:MAG: RidA family protein [Planctomycetes bacterium]|nr:RidA family protein [Planctomycetota bacterium]
MKNRVIKCLVLCCLLVFSFSCSNLKKQHEVTSIEFLSAPGSEKLALPFSEAVRVGETLYLSGQIGTIPGTTKLAPGGISGETKQALENIKEILERNGSTLNRVFKCTVFLADINEWPKMNEVYRTYFPKSPPARSAMAASGLALNARVEIECIALVDQQH